MCSSPCVAGLAYSNLVYDWVKAAVMFGVINTVATLDHLDPPQPPKCITMLYVFAETYVKTRKSLCRVFYRVNITGPTSSSIDFCFYVEMAHWIHWWYSICLMNHPKCSLLELELRLLKLLASVGGANICPVMLLVGRDFGPLCDATKSRICKILSFSLKI